MPYLSCLPLSYSLPLCWPASDLAALKGSPLLAETLLLFKHIARQYAYLHRALKVPSFIPIKIIISLSALPIAT